MGQWLLESVMGEGRAGGRPIPDWDADGIPIRTPEREGSLASKYLTGNTQRNKDPALYHSSVPGPQTEH